MSIRPVSVEADWVLSYFWGTVVSLLFGVRTWCCDIRIFCQCVFRSPDGRPGQNGWSRAFGTSGELVSTSAMTLSFVLSQMFHSVGAVGNSLISFSSAEVKQLIVKWDDSEKGWILLRSQNRGCLDNNEGHSRNSFKVLVTLLMKTSWLSSPLCLWGKWWFYEKLMQSSDPQSVFHISGKSPAPSCGCVTGLVSRDGAGRDVIPHVYDHRHVEFPVWGKHKEPESCPVCSQVNVSPWRMCLCFILFAWLQRRLSQMLFRNLVNNKSA